MTDTARQLMKRMPKRQSSYKPGDTIGDYGMVLLEFAGKRDRDWCGYFRCGRCHKRSSKIRLSDVACNHTTSCGCYAKEIYAANARKTPAEVRRANLARIPVEMLVANGRANLAKIPLEKRLAGSKNGAPLGGRKTGLRNTWAASKHRRFYHGQWYRNAYEVVFAASLVKAKLAFEYEPQTFDLGKLGTYTPDFYIPTIDLWVEVKGREFPEAMAKFVEFAKQCNTFLVRLAELNRLYPPGLWKISKYKHTSEVIEDLVLPFTLD